MKMIRIHFFLLGAVLAFAGLPLFADPPPPPTALPSSAPADEVRPPSADTAEKEEKTPSAPAVDTAPTAPTAPVVPAAPTVSEPPKANDGLRDLTVPAAEEGAKAQVEVEQEEKSKSAPRIPTVTHGVHRQEVSTVFGNAHLAPGEEADGVVAVFGNARADGPVKDGVVAVFGNSQAQEDVGDGVVAVFGNATAEKNVGDGVVAVMGDVFVNGHVNGEVVAVFGTVRLGPKAEVDGEVVSVGGRIDRAPGAIIHGQINEVAFLEHVPMFGTLGLWFHQAILKGRLLTPGHHLLWPWVIAFGFVGFYLLLSVAFGSTVNRCVETLEQRPLKTFAAALLALVVAPALMLVLLITVIGAAAVFFAVLAALLIGKASFLAWLGRRLAKPLGLSHIAVEVLFGGLLVVVLYSIPVIGLLVWMLGSTLGLGMAVYTLILTTRRDRSVRSLGAAASREPFPSALPSSVPPPMPPPAPAEAFAAAASAPFGGATATPPPLAGVETAQALPRATPPPLTVPLPSAGLPRAGFWIRVAASGLDAILVGIAAGVLHLGDLFLLLFTVYHIALWAKKGTTVGGIICGLKVVRVDDRPLDWSVAVVRALSAYLSFFVAALGFIWVAFDDDKQSWHDKIAGTTIVYVPKGVSLV